MSGLSQAAFGDGFTTIAVENDLVRRFGGPDAFGNPVSGVAVTFTAPSGGGNASVTFATSGTNVEADTTDSTGTATSSTMAANANIGTYNITASAPGTNVVNFPEQNH